jgi:Domain of unknown function (DUF4389)
MYEPPSEPPAGAALTGDIADSPVPIAVLLAGPDRQNRLTVAFRLILTIPQAVVLCFISLAAGVVAFVGWFGALFMGRLPGFAADFLSGTLRWQTRYNAYLYLLTGQYPPFSLDDDPAYPARVATEPGKLNRLAVLFRLVLVLPAALLQAVVVYGMSTIGAFVTWLIVLIRGTMPKQLHQAITAVVRYMARVSGYYWMLTAEYPWGLFGDPAEHAEFAAPGGPAVEGFPPVPPVPPDQGYGGGPPPGESAVPAAPEPGPAYGWVPPSGAAYETALPPVPAGTAAPPAAGAPGERGWRLVLSAGAKRLVWLFIALGVASVAAVAVVVGVAASSSVNAAVALSDVQTAHETLVRSAESIAATAAPCQHKADPLPCVAVADRHTARAFGAFGQSVRDTAMPSSATAAANQVVSDSAHVQRIFKKLDTLASNIQRIFKQLGTANSVYEYRTVVQALGLEQALRQFDQDYNTLSNALIASSRPRTATARSQGACPAAQPLSISGITLS